LSGGSKASPSGASGTQFTYTAIPHFVTSLLRSVSLEGSAFAVFDFTRPGRVVLEVNATKVEGTVIVAGDPLQVGTVHRLEKHI